jgi:aspartate/methionine/tyrosine aminotransferase
LAAPSLTESHRLQQVQPPIIPIVAELLRQHPDAISLGQGVVNYGPPPEAIAQIERFLADPQNHKYKPVIGLPELVEVYAKKLAAEIGIRTGDASRVVVTAGGNMAFMDAVLAIADPGDEFILQSPYYFNHEMAVTMANCRPVLVPTDAQYQLQPDAIARAITQRTRAIVTVSPNNPTGAVYSEESLRVVNGLCRERGLHHIHDEAYEYFVYDDARHFSPGSIEGAAGHTISLFSLSKSHGFASWRIGAMVVPVHLLEAVRKIQDTILICAPVISQFAAIGALQAGPAYCRGKIAELADVRRLALRELSALGERCDVPRADGAFYFLLRLRTDMHPMQVVERLVREHGVAAIPGTAFGQDEGCYLRVAYAALKADTVAEGIGRLVRGLKHLLA